MDFEEKESPPKGELLVQLGFERKERLRRYALHNHMKMAGVICKALDELIPVQDDVEEVNQ